MKDRKKADHITFFISLAMLVYCGVLTVLTIKDGPLGFEIKDLAGFGVRFETSGLRCVLACAATVLWTVTSLFSFDYMSHDRQKTRYYVFNIITLFATVGVFFAQDLFTLFIAFEMMSIASYVFVVQEETKDAIRAAGTYLAVAVIGGLVLLMGMLLFYSATGTLMISELSGAATLAAEDGKAGTLYASAICMFIGFFAKAGVFPIHIWLPKAHPVAPAPASALLSGILTKAGVYGMIIVSTSVLTGVYEVEKNPAFGFALLILGVITMIVGAVLALFSVQMKRTLACSSVSQIGFITVGLSAAMLAGFSGNTEAGELALSGMVLHMVNHSTFKLALFLLAGAIYMKTHDLSFNKIRGFGRKKPFLLVVYLISACGIGGFPMLSGYVSKTLMHEGIAEYAAGIAGADYYGAVKFAEWMFIIAGGLTVAYMLKLFTVLFLEKPEDENAKTSYSLRTYIALSVPSVLVVLFGTQPNGIFMKIADFAGCFPGEPLNVNFFSLNNLKGGLISIAIGFAVYFLIVRTFLMRKGTDGRHDFVNRWPEWLDLENSVYRPVLLNILPFIFGFVLRVLDKLLDGIFMIVQRFILRPLPERKKPPVGTRFSYAVGSFLDYVKALLNWGLLRKHPIQKSFVNAVEIGKTEANRTFNLIIRSISFALMLCCIGMLFTLIYLLSIA